LLRNVTGHFDLLTILAQPVASTAQITENPTTILLPFIRPDRRTSQDVGKTFSAFCWSPIAHLGLP
jgi:hypothetical protein